MKLILSIYNHDFVMHMKFCWDILSEANLKYILVSPYPTLFLRYGSVGKILLFFYSQIKDPRTSFVNRPNIAIKLNTNNVFQCKFVIKSSNSLGNKIL